MCIILNANQRTKNGGGLGTRLELTKKQCKHVDIFFALLCIYGNNYCLSTGVVSRHSVLMLVLAILIPKNIESTFLI